MSIVQVPIFFFNRRRRRSCRRQLLFSLGVHEDETLCSQQMNDFSTVIIFNSTTDYRRKLHSGRWLLQSSANMSWANRTTEKRIIFFFFL